ATNVYVAAEQGETRRSLHDRLVKFGEAEAQLIDPAGDYLGTITLVSLLRGLEGNGDATVDELAVYDEAVLHEDASVRQALESAERNI
ncbi:MAG: hypothetical protein GWO02_04155, partial [Gammaproteobacteria bacterium]|nr:hypothetical protein [Gammaproteobacteria bacterium]